MEIKKDEGWWPVIDLIVGGVSIVSILIAIAFPELWQFAAICVFGLAWLIVRANLTRKRGGMVGNRGIPRIQGKENKYSPLLNKSFSAQRL